MRAINLNRREKYAVAAAGCFIVLFLVYILLVHPILDKRERLARVLTKKTTELTEIRALQSQYLTLQSKADLAIATLNKRSRDFSLFSFLDSLVGDIDIEGNVSYMKPSTSGKVSTVELKLKAVTMEQLSNYLYQVEYSGKNLYVRRMSISVTNKPEGYIDVVLQVETIIV